MMQEYEISFAKGRKGPSVGTLSTKLPVLLIAGKMSRCRLQPAEVVELSGRADLDGPHLVKPDERKPAGPSTREWKTGDKAAWSSKGILQFKSKKIKKIEEGHAFFAGSETGVPISELGIPEGEV